METLFAALESDFDFRLKKCKRSKCQGDKPVSERYDYCKDCEDKFIHMIRIMSLVNDDVTPYMTMHRF